MARKRFVTSEISTDRKIAKLAEKNPTAAALWPWFITGFDDWGRMNADPIEIKLAIFPAFPYTSEEIEEFIKLYHEFEIAYFYEVDGKPYLAVNPEIWLKYQTYIRKEKLEKQNSRIPEPLGAPWIAKNNTVDDLATKNVAKQQSATINVLSPSPSPSPSKEREIDARDNTPQEKSQENFDTEIAKINNKAFEFGMNGVTPEFLEDAEMRLSEGTDVDLIIKALSIGATNAHGNACAKCRYAISVLQAWASEGIQTVEQWTQKVTPRARDKPNMPDKTAAKLDKYEKAKLEARRMLKEQGVVFDDEDTG